MSLAPTPNMGLQKPEPNVTPSPTWAEMINAIMDIIDAHDHSSGKGLSINTSGFNVNADLEFNSHFASELAGAKLDDNSAVLASSILRCLYAKDGNLYFNNGSGAAVQVTSGSAVVSSVTGAFAGYIPGAYPYTVAGADAQRVLLVDTSTARTINLPAATTNMLFCIRDITGSASTNNISVVPAGADTIDGAAATKLIKVNSSWTFLISDGVANWYTIVIDASPVPVGAIQMYGGSSAPAGYLICNGDLKSRATYAALFAIIGEAFGAGDGSTTFAIPDMRQKFPLGKAASGTGSTLGGSGGSIDHTHTIPAHYHGLGTGADLNIGSSGSHLHSIAHDHSSFTSGAGSAHSHAQNVTTPGSSDNGQVLRFDYDADYVSGNRTQFAQGATTEAESAHTHLIDVPNYTGNSASASHTHAVGDFAGRIGLVTGGVDGNAAMTSGTNNPPFVSLNYIIKT